MKIEKERLADKKSVAPWVLFEHESRFNFAAQFVKNKVVVDCACGSGIGAKSFADAEANLVFAFDIDRESIAKATLKFNKPNLSFQQAIAYSLPLDDDTADIFISFETIEHLNHDTVFLSEVTRVLKPNGFFICSTPNRTITNPRTTLNDNPWNSYPGVSEINGNGGRKGPPGAALAVDLL